MNRFWQDFNRRDHVTQLPTQVVPTRYEQSRVSPMNPFVQRPQFNTIVPNIHPSHLTNIHEHYTHHQHHFPHTTSTIHCCYETNTMCVTPFRAPKYR